MPRLLLINASPRGADSRSLSLAQAFVDAVAARREDLEVERLDLFDADLPAFGALAADAKLAELQGQEQTDDQRAAWARVREVFDHFAERDLYVFDVPYWNHGVPYPLKHFIDVVSQAGWAFDFDPGEGYSGLLGGRRAFSVYTSGVYQDENPDRFGRDFCKTYLEDWLGFIGIEDRDHVHLAPTVGNDDLEAAEREVRERAVALAERFAA
jgi:FMN-dependent NADH-azoreductase